MEIRPYKTTDYDAVMSLNKTCHAQPSPDLVLLEEIRRGRCWVADEEFDGRIVGFLVAVIKEGLPYLYNVAVDSRWRCEGVASALIEAYHEEYKQFGRYWLQVEADNPAQTLYFTRGYRVRSIGKAYYGPGKDALAMYKQA